MDIQSIHVERSMTENMQQPQAERPVRPVLLGIAIASELSQTSGATAAGLATPEPPHPSLQGWGEVTTGYFGLLQATHTLE